MRIKIRTLVKSSMQKVWQGFDRDLFMALSPPFPKIDILRFDGCEKDDEVQLKLLFPFYPQYWFARIVENSISENEIFFIDIGTRFPFFLNKWCHKHWIIKSNDTESFIIDDVDFSTGTIITDILLYPILYLQFLYRVPIYKRHFNSN